MSKFYNLKFKPKYDIGDSFYEIGNEGVNKLTIKYIHVSFDINKNGSVISEGPYYTCSNFNIDHKIHLPNRYLYNDEPDKLLKNKKDVINQINLLLNTNKN